jgi:benzoyl-CoA reductase/2-hydroxyglutaryl-CoA dehydratase subunit BcrC/BadD/HgdB
MSLPALQRIREALARRPAELAAARRRGRKVVAWMGYNVPEELIHACGLIPLRIAWGGDSRLAELGANYISTQSCFFLRQCVGLLAERKDDYTQQIDALVADATCLQLHRVTSLLEHFFALPVIHLGFPKDPALPSARKYFTAEVRHLAERLEALAGVQFDEQRLQTSVALYQEITDTLGELYRRAAAPDFSLQWAEVFEAAQAGFLLDRGEYLALLRALLQESAQEKKSPTRAAARVLLVGSSIATGDDKLICILQDAGATIVGDLLWTGYATVAGLQRQGGAMESLADAYLDRLPHAALPCLELEPDRRLMALQKLVESTGAKGVVYCSLRYCDAFSFKMQATKNWMKRLGVKTMNVQTDYGAMDLEALRTRVEAFVEMLESEC